MTFLRCDCYVGAAVDGEYPWPIIEHQCVLLICHEDDHERLDALVAKLRRGADTMLSREECDALAEMVAA